CSRAWSRGCVRQPARQRLIRSDHDGDRVRDSPLHAAAAHEGVSMATLGRRAIRGSRITGRAPAAAIARRPLANMGACVADASAAIRDRDPGPPDPRQFSDLMTRLTRAKSKLAPIYQHGMFEPFVATLTALGEAEFTRILDADVNND